MYISLVIDEMTVYADL